MLRIAGWRSIPRCVLTKKRRSLLESASNISRGKSLCLRRAVVQRPSPLKFLREEKDNPRVLIRAATAEDVLARYAGALAGGPRVLSRRIEWQEHSAGEMVSDIRLPCCGWARWCSTEGRAG